MNLRPTLPMVEEPPAGALSLTARLHVDVTIPRTAIKARMRLVSRDEAFAIKSSVFGQFKDAFDAQVNSLTVAEWNNEVAVRHLAAAVRDPADETRPLARLEDWRACDDDQIAALWEQYQDLRDKLDPLGEDAAPLTEREFGELEAASKKKDVAVLTSFGSRKLARYAIILASRPAS
jgi:hypothetical protein